MDAMASVGARPRVSLAVGGGQVDVASGASGATNGAAAHGCDDSGATARRRWCPMARPAASDREQFIWAIRSTFIEGKFGWVVMQLPDGLREVAKQLAAFPSRVIDVTNWGLPPSLDQCVSTIKQQASPDLAPVISSWCDAIVEMTHHLRAAAPEMANLSVGLASLAQGIGKSHALHPHHDHKIALSAVANLAGTGTLLWLPKKDVEYPNNAGLLTGWRPLRLGPGEIVFFAGDQGPSLFGVPAIWHRGDMTPGQVRAVAQAHWNPTNHQGGWAYSR
jgi:hypothetical protein